jgi:peptide deformylase
MSLRNASPFNLLAVSVTFNARNFTTASTRRKRRMPIHTRKRVCGMIKNSIIITGKQIMEDQTSQDAQTSQIIAPSDKLYIRLYTDKVLQTTCEPVTVIDDSLMELAGKMIATMRINRGVGLSANQVGINKQFCVVSLEKGTRQMALINPIIIHKSKERIKLYEGCLSAPGVYPPTKRYQKVVVQFQNLKGDKSVFEMTDLDARIIQHELDHLAGKMVIDSYRSIKSK